MMTEKRTDKRPRVSFTAKITPETRDALRRWAFEHNRPASEAIERLTAEYLERLA